jgi:hypothetical protein
VRSKLRGNAAARRGYAQLAKRYADRIERMRTEQPVDTKGLTPAL